MIGNLHEATLLEDVPENNKQVFKREQALRQDAWKDINFEECDEKFARRAAKFYRVMFSNASKMIAANEQQFLSYERQIKSMHQECATRCSASELQELKNEVDKNVLKYNNLYKIFKKKCFPACVLLDNMSMEYLKKIGLTSEKGFGRKVFDLIKEYYECSGRKYPDYLKNKRNREFLWFECKLATMVLTKFNALKNTFCSEVVGVVGKLKWVGFRMVKIQLTMFLLYLHVTCYCCSIVPCG